MIGRRAATFVIGLTLAATSLAGGPLTAQDQTFSLPTPTASPRGQGPVDSDNPIVISTPRPEPGTPPAPAPAPSPAPSAAAPAPSPTARPTARPATRPAAAPSPAPARPQAAPSQPATTVSPAPAATPSAEPVSTAAAPLPAPSGPATTAESPGATNWPLLGGVALLLLLLGLGARKLLRKTEPEPETSDETAWIAPSPESAPAPPEPPAEPIPAEPIPAEPIPSPVFAAPDASPLACSFAAKRISATLLNAQLDYRIELVNDSGQTIELIAIHGDMIGAHASFGSAQMAEGQTGLPVLHRVPRLAAGERTELFGSIRLPLAQIQAVRQGSAALFVPLVRLWTRATTHDGEAIALPQTFVLGEPPLSDGSGLRPFRLDLGPRIYNQVLARIVTPAG